jgi:hypothetical protein
VGNIAFGLGCLIMGLVFLIFNKFIARWHIEIQNDLFGFHFGERERKATRIVAVLGGIFFSAVGSLVLLSALSFI